MDAITPRHIRLIPRYIRESLGDLSRAFCAFRRTKGVRIEKPAVSPTRQSSTKPSVSNGRPLQSNAPQRAVRKGRSRMRPFPLSIVFSRHGHSKHTEDCFVAHLLDAVRLNNARHDLQQALTKLEAEYTSYTSYISTCNGHKAIMARHPFDGIETSLEIQDFNIKMACKDRTKGCADEEVF